MNENNDFTKQFRRIRITKASSFMHYSLNWKLHNTTNVVWTASCLVRLGALAWPRRVSSASCACASTLPAFLSIAEVSSLDVVKFIWIFNFMVKTRAWKKRGITDTMKMLWLEPEKQKFSGTKVEQIIVSTYQFPIPPWVKHYKFPQS